MECCFWVQAGVHLDILEWTMKDIYRKSNNQHCFWSDEDIQYIINILFSSCFIPHIQEFIGLSGIFQSEID